MYCENYRNFKRIIRYASIIFVESLKIIIKNELLLPTNISVFASVGASVAAERINLYSKTAILFIYF